MSDKLTFGVDTSILVKEVSRKGKRRGAPRGDKEPRQRRERPTDRDQGSAKKGGKEKQSSRRPSRSLPFAAPYVARKTGGLTCSET